MADTVALRVAVTDVDRAVAELRKIGVEASTSFRRVKDAADSTSRSLQEGTAGMSRAAGARMQQVGFQVQDLIVQLQGGARPLTAFVQQGTQIAGAFGPLGAILGAVGAGAAIAVSSLIGMYSATDQAATGAEALKQAQAGVEKAMGETAGTADALGKYYRSLTADVRALEEQTLAAKLAQLDLVRVQAGKNAGDELRRTLADNLGSPEAAQRQLQTIRRSNPAIGSNRALDDLAGPDDPMADYQYAKQQAEIEAANVLAANRRLLARRLDSGDSVAKIAAEYSEIVAKAPGATEEMKKSAAAMRDQARAEAEALKTHEETEARLRILRTGKVGQAERDVLGGQEPKPSSEDRAAERSAKRADSYRAELAQREAMLDLERLSAQRQVEAAGLSETALELEQRRLAVEKEVLQERQRAADAGVTLTAQQVDGLRQAIEETMRLRAETQQLAQDWRATERDRATRQGSGTSDLIGPVRPPDDAARRAGERELAQDAARQARILTAPFERAGAAIQGTFSDVFTGVLDEGGVKAGELAEKFSHAMNSSIGQFPALLASAPMTSAIDALSKQLTEAFSGDSMDLSKLASNPMVAGAAGMGVGSLASGLMGGNSTGSSLGGLAGAGLGFLLGGPAGAFFGGAIGGIGGGLLGNLVGGSGGNNRANSKLDLGLGLLLPGSDTKSGQNQQLTNNIAQELAQVQQLLMAGGAAFAPGELRIRAGDKSGYDLRYGGQTTAFDSLRELRTGALDTVLGSASGLTQSFQTVIAATKGARAEVIQDSLAFAAAFDRMVDPSQALVLELNALNSSFAQASAKAGEYGLSVDAVREAQTRAQDELMRNAEDGLRSQVDQVQATFASLIDPIRNTLQGFAAGPLSVLNPQDQLSGSRGAFEALATQALSGDQEAIRALSGSAQAYLQQARDFGASGAGYQSTYQQVTDVLSRVGASLEAQRDDVLSVVPQAFRDVSREQTAELKAKLSEVVSAVERLQAEITKARRAA